LYRFQTKVARLTQELGRKPTVEEISKSLEMEEGAVRDMLKGVPTEVSLEMRIGEEDEKRLEDVLQDMSITPLDEVLIRQSLEEQLNTLLEQLDEKERLIIQRRFGLGDREPETLAEIGGDLKLSRERVRQIEEKALNKLRRSQRARQLASHLN
jgi:RNA polymerase nonessential primary-like sigma factor